MATTTLSKHLYGDSLAEVRHRASCLAQCSEWFWFCLSLLLFIILGPFSAPVAVVVVVRLGMAGDPCQEPESLTTR